VNPVGKSRYEYWWGPAGGADPDAWLAQAEEGDGSWWPLWAEWLLSRSGKERPSPPELGSHQYPPGDPAPGRYVHEE
jgi:polyhydroxyalkanoate synthase